MAGDSVSNDLSVGIIDCAEAAFEALAIASLNPSSEGVLDALADAYLPIPPSAAFREHERSIHIWSDCLALWLSKRERR